MVIESCLPLTGVRWLLIEKPERTFQSHRNVLWLDLGDDNISKNVLNYKQDLCILLYVMYNKKKWRKRKRSWERQGEGKLRDVGRHKTTLSNWLRLGQEDASYY